MSGPCGKDRPFVAQVMTGAPGSTGAGTGSGVGSGSGAGCGG